MALQTRSDNDISYYLINEVMATPDTVEKYAGIVSENHPKSGPSDLFTITFDTVLTEFNCTNWNGRNYPRDVFMNALQNDPLIKRDLEHGAWGMEISHPEIEKGQNEIARQLKIEPKYLASTLDKYWEKGNILMGRCTTVARGWGDVLRDRILTGFPPMVSSRAIGGVDKHGNVMPGMTLVCWDNCCRPSSRNAYGVPGSEKINYFNHPVGASADTSTTIAESAVTEIDRQSESLKNFLLSESITRDQIERTCTALGLDYTAMSLNEDYSAVVIENVGKTTRSRVVMPLKTMIGANYNAIFDYLRH